MIILANEQGLPFWWAWGTSLQGTALTAQGQWDEGVRQLRQGIDALVGEIALTYFLAWLAEGYRGTGQVEDGFAAIAEALRLVEKNDERIYEAEVYRIRGELLLQKAERGRQEADEH